MNEKPTTPLLDLMMAELNRDMTKFRDNEDIRNDKELMMECFRDIFIVFMELRKEMSNCQKLNE